MLEICCITKSNRKIVNFFTIRIFYGVIVYKIEYSKSSFLLHPYLTSIGFFPSPILSSGIVVDAHAIRSEFHSIPIFPSEEMDMAPPYFKRIEEFKNI